MKRKALSMLLAVSMAFALTACAGGGNNSNSASGASNASVSDNSAADSVSDSSADSASDTATDSTGADDTASADVMTHEEYVAAELDTEVTIETYVQAKQSWWEDEGQGKATVYGQSEDGAYFMYDMACSQEDYEKLVPGTKIRVTGYKAEWSGEVEIMDGSFEIVEGDEFIATALDATELLGTDELINHQNELVQFKGMTVEPANPDGDASAAFLYNYDGSGSEGDDLYFNASYNGQTYTFVIESYLCDSSTEVYSAVKALQVGQTIDMEGFLYWYEGANPHITSVSVVE